MTISNIGGIGRLACKKPYWAGCIFLSCSGNARQRRKFVRQLRADGYIVETKNNMREGLNCANKKPG